MDTLKIQYDKIVSEKKVVMEQINDLKNNDIKIKRYLDLLDQNDQLASQQRDLYKQMKFEEYSSCNHIWINVFRDYDWNEGRSYNYCGCIKCGLDQSVLKLTEQYYGSDLLTHDLDLLTLDQRIMYEFMEDRFCYKGIYTKILCDLDLAKSIYSKINESYPNIDDETAIKYFESALNNIRKNKVNDDRKVNRSRRLSLNPEFNKWTGWDVSSH